MYSDQLAEKAREPHGTYPSLRLCSPNERNSYEISIEIDLDALQAPEEFRGIISKIAEEAGDYYDSFTHETIHFKHDIYGNGYFDQDINGIVVAGSKFYLKDFPEDN